MTRNPLRIVAPLIRVVARRSIDAAPLALLDERSEDSPGVLDALDRFVRKAVVGPTRPARIFLGVQLGADRGRVKRTRARLAQIVDVDARLDRRFAGALDLVRDRAVEVVERRVAVRVVQSAQGALIESDVRGGEIAF